MTAQKITSIISQFQFLSDKHRRQFLRAFEKKMLYRTTKTENPETTVEMVDKVFKKHAIAA